MTNVTESVAESLLRFQDLNLAPAVLKAVTALGYEVPTPIQAAAIPIFLSGRDLVGQAQTGTGKTAAFALPLLSNLDLKRKDPQVLILTPTRELSIQVAEAFSRYASGLADFHVAPIYGGQDMVAQLRKLKRGLHVVVGTPGRVMDHMRRGTLKLDGLTCMVLDEADEMLRMGFIEDVEWVLEQVPDTCQIGLFSATMPPEIRRIARKHLEDPAEITIAQKIGTATGIRQRYWIVDGMHKMTAMTRILETEDFEGILVFVRTKTMTVELATKLEAQGFSAAALSGDVPQSKREETVARLKSGRLDIVVATDVAARGLDINRISHVINYDIPHNAEAYIHRIGRTGRAGRSGDAILFVAPRERGLLGQLQKATRQKFELMEMPTSKMIYAVRLDRFRQKISDTLAGGDLAPFREIVERLCQESNVPALDIAVALARLLHNEKPLPLQKSADIVDVVERQRSDKSASVSRARTERPEPRAAASKPSFVSREAHTKSGFIGASPAQDRKAAGRETETKAPSPSPHPVKTGAREDSPHRRKREDARIPMIRYRIHVGKEHGATPGAIAEVITREAGLERRYIGAIDIGESTTTIELPDGMPSEIYRNLKKVELAGRLLRIAFVGGSTGSEKKRS